MADSSRKDNLSDLIGQGYYRKLLKEDISVESILNSISEEQLPTRELKFDIYTDPEGSPVLSGMIDSCICDKVNEYMSENEKRGIKKEDVINKPAATYIKPMNRLILTFTRKW